MPVVTKRIRKKVKGNNGWWSNEERIEAVKTYLILGVITHVAAATGIPEITLRKWKAQDWWKEAEEEYRNSSKIEVSGKLSRIVNKTITALEDRVSNGDFFFNPVSKKWERKPVGANILHKITSDLIDKQLILEKDTTKEKTSDEGINSRLDKLRDEMIKFAKARKPVTVEGEIIDVTETVVPENRGADQSLLRNVEIEVLEGEGGRQGSELTS